MLKKVFCIGVWDLFHCGHLSIIKQARDIGDVHVGVVCDEAVSKLKGTNKPVIPARQRRDIIENIKGVKSAFLVWDFEIPLNAENDYDFILLGGDQQHIKGVERIPENKIIRLERPNDGISTTAIMKKIKGDV